ncbi:MAG: hypothetical protein CM1200mP34_3870 [Verrucomicrobiales bacterium]|nr:MAG: hypothetical protein CM1200mP34_3870 [Verrucomicrobiales bacterium]
MGGDCVFEQPDRVRERIGYMPENNPLPPDLRVADYLGFRAQLKRLANGKAARRVGEVMEQCGIADVANRFIDQFSLAATGNGSAWPMRCWPSRS